MKMPVMREFIPGPGALGLAGGQPESLFFRAQHVLCFFSSVVLGRKPTDRGAWQATALGLQRVGLDLVTKQHLA